MNDSLYSKKITCPICNEQFLTMQTKINSCRVKKRDEDFCTHYKGINPTYYEIYVCPGCAYSATENSFESIEEVDIELLREAFLGRKVSKNFCNERTLEDAIAACKLAIHTAESRKAGAGVLGGLCLKLAWLYRFAEDEQEYKFLDYALRYYLEAYETEKMPLGNLDEITVMYLIGELSRRLGKYNDAAAWFGKVIMNPDRSQNMRIDKLAREQLSLTKEQYKKTENRDIND